ncbi:uncharacterized protein EAF01_001293 [Botrytis porri]|uniref:uncharacterized protein n=1 Tax=Botrytis porri TaxID=87229 RepID=UPI0019029B4F|nr:uncharacterized protein EAF01_001293 [Botrytis porri]KAF7912272.1 hypothetical protein EAF01_001293 [Botrytis porri]
MYVNGPPLFAVEQNNAQLAVVALELAAGVEDITALELIAADEEAAPLDTAMVEDGRNEIIELLGPKVDSELETEVTESELKVTVGSIPEDKLETLPDSTAEVADADVDPDVIDVPEVDTDSDKVKLLEADAESVADAEINELPEVDADSEESEDDNEIEEMETSDERLDTPVSIAELCERTAELEVICTEVLAATDEDDSIEIMVLLEDEDVSRTVEVPTVISVDNAAEDWTGKSEEVATTEERIFDEVAATPEEVGVFELITVDKLPLTESDALAATEEDPGTVERTLLLEGTASEDKVLVTEIYTEDNCDSEILKVGRPIDEEGLPELPEINVDSGRLLPEEVGSKALLVAAGFEVDWLETIGAVVVIDSGPALDVGRPEEVATVEDGAAEQKLG